MFVLGIAGLVAPLDGKGISSVDLYVMLGVTILLLPTVWTGRIIDRKEGFLFPGNLCWLPVSSVARLNCTYKPHIFKFFISSSKPDPNLK
jgi:hypothetical protein